MMLEQAREQASALIGARPDEVYFLPSGTAAVHAGIAGILAGRRRHGRHLVVTAVEHSAVLASAQQHQSGGGELSIVPVDRDGRVEPGTFADALRTDTALACLQTANHEVGSIQPVDQVQQACARLQVPLLLDAAQSLGWSAPSPGWSALIGSAHKWGGPAGVGLLALRTGTRWQPPWPSDQRGWGGSPGYENVPAIVAAVIALEQARATATDDAVRLSALVDHIRSTVPEILHDVEVVGHPHERLPNIVTFSCLYADGESLQIELDRAGLAISSGSSCSSSTLEPSHVLVAMGALTSGNVRVSLPRTASERDVEHLLAVLPDAVARVRAAAGAGEL